MQVGQIVKIKAGRYKGPYEDDRLAYPEDRENSKIRHYPEQQGWIGFPGNKFGGCPTIGEVIPKNSTCWVRVSLRKNGRWGHQYIEVPTNNLTLVATAADLEKEFKKRLESLQKICPHPDVSQDFREHQVPAFYEMDSPDWKPEYTRYAIHQCKACLAYLRPGKQKQWLPGKSEGYRTRK